MRFPTRREFVAALAGFGGVAGTGAVRAGAYPDKPIKLIVPYAPGGPTDISARLVSDKLSARLGQPVVIDNRGGAGGTVGAEAAARSAGDGYTLVLVTTGHAVNPSLYPKLGYDLGTDLVPIAQLISSPMVVTVSPSLPVTTIKELIALAKSKPGELAFASAGNGSSTHLAVELFCMMAGVKMTHVPYKGSAPALSDVMAGHVQVAFDYMISALPHVRGGRLKGLAVTSAARSAAAPELPTVAEAGVPGFEAIGWNGVMAPARTPQEVIAKLSREIRAVLALPDVTERITGLGSMPHWSSSADFGALVKAEIANWGKVVKASGAKVD
ncbi:MAG: tripartite tricarboxylate transporter substrate binding protein [Burkholderiales bacterium]